MCSFVNCEGALGLYLEFYVSGPCLSHVLYVPVWATPSHSHPCTPCTHPHTHTPRSTWVWEHNVTEQGARSVYKVCEYVQESAPISGLTVFRLLADITSPYFQWGGCFQKSVFLQKSTSCCTSSAGFRTVSSFAQFPEGFPHF